MIISCTPRVKARSQPSPLSVPLSLGVRQTISLHPQLAPSFGPFLIPTHDSRGIPTSWGLQSQPTRRAAASLENVFLLVNMATCSSEFSGYSGPLHGLVPDPDS